MHISWTVLLQADMGNYVGSKALRDSHLPIVLLGIGTESDVENKLVSAFHSNFFITPAELYASPARCYRQMHKWVSLVRRGYRTYQSHELSNLYHLRGLCSRYLFRIQPTTMNYYSIAGRRNPSLRRYDSQRGDYYQPSTAIRDCRGGKWHNPYQGKAPSF